MDSLTVAALLALRMGESRQRENDSRKSRRDAIQFVYYCETIRFKSELWQQSKKADKQD